MAENLRHNIIGVSASMQMRGTCGVQFLLSKKLGWTDRQTMPYKTTEPGYGILVCVTHYPKIT